MSVDKALGYVFTSVMLLLVTVCAFAFVPWPWVLLPIAGVGFAPGWFIYSVLEYAMSVWGR